MRGDKEPRRQTTTVTLPEAAFVRAEGYVMEGHPDRGCPGPNGQNCDDKQFFEELRVLVGSEDIGQTKDRGDIHQWVYFGPFWTRQLLPPGPQTITVAHLWPDGSKGAQSVEFRITICGVPPALGPTAAATATPSPGSAPPPTP